MDAQFLEGFDASHFNGITDMAQAKNAGKSFAIFKATDGLTFTDPTFASKIHSAIGLGLVSGAYHFLRPTDDPRAQARFFVSVISAWAPLIPILDIEWAPNPTTNQETWDTLTPGQRTVFVLAFLSEFELHFKGLIHLYLPPVFAADFLGNLDLSAYPLMVPDYSTIPPATPKLPPFFKKASIHQYTAKGNVPGIIGPVDLDYFAGTIDDLKALTCVPV